MKGLLFSAWGACKHSYTLFLEGLSLDMQALSLPGFCNEPIGSTIDPDIYLNFISQKLTAKKWSLVIGHSLGANQILSLASLKPTLFEHIDKIFLIDPALNRGPKPFQKFILNNYIPNFLKILILKKVHKRSRVNLEEYKTLYRVEFKSNLEFIKDESIRKKIVVISGSNPFNVHPNKDAKSFTEKYDLRLVYLIEEPQCLL